MQQHHKNNIDQNTELKDSDLFLDSEKSCCNKTLLIIVLILIAALVGGYYIYNSYNKKNNEEIIIISAEENEDENKEQPLDPGGMVVHNVDKDVYDTIDKSTKKASNEIETLLPPAEEPVNKKEIANNTKEERIPATNNTKITTIAASKDSTIKEEDYIKPITKTTSKKKNKFAHRKDNFYRVQIASFKSKKDAEKQWSILSKRYKKLLSPYQHYITSKDIKDKGIFQRLQVGPFENERAAKKACSTFKDAGLNCFIIKP